MILELLRNLRQDVDSNEQRPSAEEICARLDVVISLIEKSPSIERELLQQPARGESQVAAFPLGTPMPSAQPSLTPQAPPAMPQPNIENGGFMSSPPVLPSAHAEPIEPIAD